jgi:hypothetical protein
LAEAAISIIKSLVDGISQNREMLTTTATETIVFLATSLISMLPEIVQLGLDLVESLALGLSENVGELIPAIADIIGKITDILTNPDMFQNMLYAALEIVTAIVEGLGEAVPILLDAAIKLMDSLTIFILDPENLSKIVNAALRIIIALGGALVASIPRLVTYVHHLTLSIIKNISNTDWGKVGKNIVDGLLKGLKKAWGSIKKWFTDAFNDIVGGVNDLLGIHSPSRVFAGIGKNMALGVGEGWEDTFGDVEDDIDSSLDFGEADYGITTSSTSISDFGGASSRYGYGSSQNVNVTVGIDNNANAMGLARALLPFLKIAEKEVYA